MTLNTFTDLSTRCKRTLAEYFNITSNEDLVRYIEEEPKARQKMLLTPYMGVKTVDEIYELFYVLKGNTSFYNMPNEERLRLFLTLTTETLAHYVHAEAQRNGRDWNTHRLIEQAKRAIRETKPSYEPEDVEWEPCVFPPHRKYDQYVIQLDPKRNFHYRYRPTDSYHWTAGLPQ